MTDLLEYTIVGGIKIPNRLLSRKEVATILNLDVVTVWRLAKRVSLILLKSDVLVAIRRDRLPNS